MQFYGCLCFLLLNGCFFTISMLMFVCNFKYMNMIHRKLMKNINNFEHISLCIPCHNKLLKIDEREREESLIVSM